MRGSCPCTSGSDAQRFHFLRPMSAFFSPFSVIFCFPSLSRRSFLSSYFFFHEVIRLLNHALQRYPVKFLPIYLSLTLFYLASLLGSSFLLSSFLIVLFACLRLLVPGICILSLFASYSLIQPTSVSLIDTTFPFPSFPSLQLSLPSPSVVRKHGGDAHFTLALVLRRCD